MSLVTAHCPDCQESFEVPASLAGGLSNCPHCQRAVEVEGGPELLFWLLLGFGIVGAILITAVVYAALGTPAALTLGSIFAGLIVVAVLCS